MQRGQKCLDRSCCLIGMKPPEDDDAGFRPWLSAPEGTGHPAQRNQANSGQGPEMAPYVTCRSDSDGEVIIAHCSGRSAQVGAAESFVSVPAEDQEPGRVTFSDGAAASSKDGLGFKVKPRVTFRRLTQAIGAMISTRTRRKPYLPRSASTNSNKTSDFLWLDQLLASIADGSGSLDVRVGARPLFVVAGACPNRFCGTQAMMFCGCGEGSVDFWWVKPNSKDNTTLEPNTLPRTSAGPHTNLPKASAKLYSPFAQRFAGMEDGSFAFGVEKGRAYVEDRKTRERLLLYLIWQESWSGLFSSTKFMEGKICYQKDSMREGPSGSCAFFARQYRVEGDEMKIAPAEEEEELAEMMPPPSFQAMYDMTMR